MTLLPRTGIEGSMTDYSLIAPADSRFALKQGLTWVVGLACSVVALAVFRLRKEGDTPLLEVVCCLLLGVIPHALLFLHERRLFARMPPPRRWAYALTLLSRGFVPINLLAYRYGGYFFIDEFWGASWFYLSLLANGYALVVPFFADSKMLPVFRGRFHTSAAASFGIAELAVYGWWASGG